MPGFGFRLSETTRALPQTGNEVTAGVGDVLFRILAGFVTDTQLDRIEVQLFRELVHRAFQRQQPDRLTRRAHRGRDRDIQCGQAMPRQPVGTGVERAGLHRGALELILRVEVA
jgi:hypothetical protein